MGYDHTQRAPVHWILWGVAAAMAAGAWFARGQAPAWIVLLVACALIGFLALCFRTLTVRDGGDALVIRFGPLPVFGRRVPYARMAGVRAARSRVVDGWGIHWVPRRGWTWNLWGRDCVEVETASGLLRIGSDDRDGLCTFLAARLGTGAA